MSEAFGTYEKYRKGIIARFPNRFWAPPEGFARVIEVVRKVAAEEGIHRSEVNVARIKAWGLYSPFIKLFGGKLSKIRELAATGLPAAEPEARSFSSTRGRPRLTNAVMSEVWIRDGGKCGLWVDRGS